MVSRLNSNSAMINGMKSLREVSYANLDYFRYEIETDKT